ncbi:TVP38/TMEM64 family protein (plasmid) [Priestia aryabhattai]
MRIAKQIIFAFLLIDSLVLLVPYVREVLLLFNTATIKDLLEKYDSAAKLIYFLICFLQPILLPLPEAVTVSVGSAMFGSLTSIFLSFTGTILGIVVMYFIAKVGGQKLVLKLVKERHLKRYQEYVGKNETTILALLFIIPVLPDEIICVGAGISGVSFKRFLIIASISKLITSSVLSYSVYFTKSLSLTSSEIIMLCSGVMAVILVATVVLKKLLKRKNVQKVI